MCYDKGLKAIKKLRWKRIFFHHHFLQTSTLPWWQPKENFSKCMMGFVYTTEPANHIRSANTSKVSASCILNIVYSDNSESSKWATVLDMPGVRNRKVTCYMQHVRSSIPVCYMFWSSQGFWTPSELHNFVHTVAYHQEPILRSKKDDDWYIYPQFLAHNNFKNVYKNVQKRYKIFKPRLLDVLCTGTNIINIWLS